MTRSNSYDPAVDGELSTVYMTDKELTDIQADNAARKKAWVKLTAAQNEKRRSGIAPSSFPHNILNIFALPPVSELPQNVGFQHGIGEHIEDSPGGPIGAHGDLRALEFYKDDPPSGYAGLPLPESKLDDPVYGEGLTGSMDLKSWEYGKDLPHLALEKLRESGVGRLIDFGPRGIVDFAKILTLGRAGAYSGINEADGIREVKTELGGFENAVHKADGFTRLLGVGVSDLDAGVNELGGGLQITSDSMDGMSASMGLGRQEALALAGDLGMLEDQGLATADVLRLLAAMPRMPTGAGGTSGGTTSTSSQPSNEDDFLSTPPPPNVEALFQSQKDDQGHDISGFRDARHWWREHLKHVAQLRAEGHAFAQGTRFAPGGMALVGEMGPELVNLPRGSQVIPNPQLGSAVTVNVTVEGSVVAERDLAQRIRQELIRTSRRTVDLGFVT